MPLSITTPRIIGTKIRAFRDGAAFTVPSAGNASRDALPGPTDTGWLDWGCVAETGLTPESEKKEIFCPSPGQYTLDKVILTKKKLSGKIKLQYFSPLSIELGFHTGPLTSASTTFTPNVGSTKMFWLEFKHYDDTDALIATVYMFCVVSLDGGLTMNQDVCETNIDFMQLNSAVDAGTL